MALITVYVVVALLLQVDTNTLVRIAAITVVIVSIIQEARMQVNIALDPRLQLEAAMFVVVFIIMVLGHYLPYKGWIAAPWTYVYGLGTILVCSWYVMLSASYTGTAALWLISRMTVAAGVATILCHEIDKRSMLHKKNAETEMKLKLGQQKR